MTVVSAEEIAARAAALADDVSATVTVERYYVEPGATVEVGDPMCLLRSDRYVYDVPAERGGVVGQILISAGEVVAIGTALIQLGDSADRVAPAIPAPAPERGAPIRRATPLARKLAKIHGLDLQLIAGSGAGERIRSKDVRACLAAEEASRPMDRAQAPELDPFSLPSDGQRIVLPQSFMPQYSLPRVATTMEVDMEQIVRSCSRVSGATEAPLMLCAYLAAAVVTALVEHPRLNSTWSEDGIILHSCVNLGIVMGAREQNVAHTIARAGDLNGRGFARALEAAQTQRQEGAKKAERETFTLVYGAHGLSWWSVPALHSPHAAVLHIGAVARRPVVLEMGRTARVGLRSRSLMTLCYDARHILQPEADAFLLTVRRRLEGLRSL